MLLGAPDAGCFPASPNCCHSLRVGQGDRDRPGTGSDDSRAGQLSRAEQWCVGVMARKRKAQ